MQDVTYIVGKVKEELAQENSFSENNKKILYEITEILDELDDRVELLEYPTLNLIDVIDDFGGTENPLFMFIAFIFKHLDDYFIDGVLGDFLDFDDE